MRRASDYALPDGVAPADAVRDGGFARRPGGLSSSTTTRAAWSSSSRALRRAARKASRGTTCSTTSRCTWLTNTGVSSARLYWENKFSFFGVKRRHDPGRRERLPRRALPGPAELGGAGVSQPHPLQQARQGRALRRPGNSRSSSWKSCAPGSSPCGSKAVRWMARQRARHPRHLQNEGNDRGKCRRHATHRPQFRRAPSSMESTCSRPTTRQRKRS